MSHIMAGSDLFRDSGFPFHIDKYAIAPNYHIPPHTHDFIELVYVVSGSAEHDMPGHRYPLRPGDVFVLEPNVYHSYTGSPHEETVVYNVLFDPALLRAELDALLQMTTFAHFFYFTPFMRTNASFVPYHPLAPDEAKQIEQQLDGMHNEYNRQLEGYQLVVKTRFIECLVWLSRFLTNKRPDERRRERGHTTDLERMDAIRHFIEAHYKQNLTLAGVSHIAGMSVSSFTAKFREATGTSLLEYKQRVQIRRACELLADTDRKILDVALEVGFNDISFFNRIFRKHRGMTPREYRKRLI